MIHTNVELLLDLEKTKNNPIIKQKEQIQSAISQATLKQLDKILEMFQNLDICKMYQVRT